MKRITFKTILIFFGVFCTCGAYGQDESIVDFGVHVTPVLTVPINNNNSYLQFEHGSGIELGADLFLGYSSNFQLKFDVNYSSFTAQFNDYRLVFFCDLDLLAGSNIDNIDRSYVSENFNIQALGIGIASRVKLAGEKNHLYSKFGLDGKLILNSSLLTESVECGEPPRMITREATLRDIYWQFTTGIGYEFGIVKQTKLFIEPEVNIALKGPVVHFDLLQENPQQYLFLNLGVNMGLRF